MALAEANWCTVQRTEKRRGPAARQPPVRDHSGKERDEECVCVYVYTHTRMTESLCYSEG